MGIFEETYTVVSVEEQRLVLRGVQSGDVLTITNADPKMPLLAEDYPIGQKIKLSEPASSSVN